MMAKFRHFLCSRKKDSTSVAEKTAQSVSLMAQAYTAAAGRSINETDLPAIVDELIWDASAHYYDARGDGRYTPQSYLRLDDEGSVKVYSVAGKIARHKFNGSFASESSFVIIARMLGDYLISSTHKLDSNHEQRTYFQVDPQSVPLTEFFGAKATSLRQEIEEQEARRFNCTIDKERVALLQGLAGATLERCRYVDLRLSDHAEQYMEAVMRFSEPFPVESGYGYGQGACRLTLHYAKAKSIITLDQDAKPLELKRIIYRERS